MPTNTSVIAPLALVVPATTSVVFEEARDDHAEIVAPEPGLKNNARIDPTKAARSEVTKYQIITLRPILPNFPVGREAEPLIKDKNITGTTIIFNIDTNTLPKGDTIVKYNEIFTPLTHRRIPTTRPITNATKIRTIKFFFILSPKQ
jgi:hypothetical protein